MNPQEFAQKIKAKYPQYNDVDDATLAQKVIEKYPQYKASVTMAEAPKKSILEKTTGVVNAIFPGKRLGEAVGNSIDAIRGLASGDMERFGSSADANARLVAPVAGDVASIGLNLATAGGAGTAGKFVPQLLKSIGLGAGISGAEAVAEGGSIGEVGKSATIGGVVGGGIPVVGKGLSGIARQFSELPERFVNSAIGRSKAQIIDELKSNKDSLAKYVIENKKPLSANRMLEESAKAVEDLGEKISANLSNSIRKDGVKVTLGRDNILDAVAVTPDAEGALLGRNDVRAIIERLAPQSKKLLQRNSLNLEEANRLRQLLDRTLGDRAFLGAQLSSDKAVLKSFANTLREEVKKKAPQGTREMFGELSNEIGLRNNLLEKVAMGERNQIFSLSDIISGLAGSVGGIPGAVATVAVKRAAESTPVKIGSAKIINALSKAAPDLERLAPAQQLVIMNLFSELFSPDSTSESGR
jgi:hypothetical protein